MSLDKMIVYEWTTTDILRKQAERKASRPEIRYLIEPASIPEAGNDYFPPGQEDAKYGTYW